jgi:hypothetical protein
MAVEPGQPQTLLVAVTPNITDHGGTRVYDNAVLRADVITPQAGEFSRWLVPGATAGTYLSQSVGQTPAFNNMQRLLVDATGVHVDASTASVSNIVVSSRPQRAGNRLFLRDGRVLDATNGTLLWTLALPEATAPHAVLVDEANSRVLVWMDVDVDQRSVLISYDLATLQPLAYLALYDTGEVKGSRAVMTTWGTDGVALADGNRVVILSGAFFSTYRGAPTP